MSDLLEIISLALLNETPFLIHLKVFMRLSTSGNQFRCMNFRRSFLKKATHDFGDYLYLYLYLLKNYLWDWTLSHDMILLFW